MKQERTVYVEGKAYIVVLSDEREALLAAKAAGRAVVGVESQIERGAYLPARYVVGIPEAADERYLERVVRRHLGLPWVITETERLVIREFAADDAAHVPHESGGSSADSVFYTQERLEEYIRYQYGFYEYGVWALADKTKGVLVGKAGVVSAAGLRESLAGCGGVPDGAEETTELELGYHIFEPYRGQGYAAEACRGILRMLESEYAGSGMSGLTVWARTDAGNAASIHVLNRCGFESFGDLPVREGAGFCRLLLFFKKFSGNS